MRAIHVPPAAHKDVEDAEDDDGEDHFALKPNATIVYTVSLRGAP